MPHAKRPSPQPSDETGGGAAEFAERLESQPHADALAAIDDLLKERGAGRNPIVCRTPSGCDVLIYRIPPNLDRRPVDLRFRFTSAAQEPGGLSAPKGSPFVDHGDYRVAEYYFYSIDITNQQITLEEESFPHWDGRARELRFQDRVCLKYKRSSGSQIPILERFQQDEWPEVIGNPLTGNKPHPRMVQGVKDLNKKLGSRGPIRFRVEGSGVAWERNP